ncbi:MAG: cyclopropane-fatty-acyl-phospholipid synthase [Verrucomicrobiae bacterium]|nr:cyclopropane-fatty-acyl-phospholipid synthase [Verrucomicrobiae bacterium]
MTHATVTEFVPLAKERYVSKSIWEYFVLDALKKMKRGGLCVETCDRPTRYFGEPGARITAHVTIHEPAAFFKRCALYGDIGLGEAYSNSLWDTKDIKAVISWFIENLNFLQGKNTSATNIPSVNFLTMLNWVKHLLRDNNLTMSRRNITEHYDLGNDFYALWLDPSMTYSSAKFKDRNQSLQEAQAFKYDSLCRKLQLQPTDHLLEIGSGWGGFALHAAKNYGCKITGITLSPAQAEYAKEKIAAAGLENQISIEIKDYRHLSGSYDKIVSIEMLEAVGDRYHQAFFSQCDQLLKPKGLLGLQMITVPDHRYSSLKRSVDWIQRHIFPGSLLLSIGRVNEVLLNTSDLFLHDLEDLGNDYARTLAIWHENFNAVLPQVRKLGFDEAFIRSWNYYLKYCEAAFTTRNISVVQAVYTRPNNNHLQRSFGKES